MQNIQSGSQEKIYLNVYSNGVLTQADQVPTFTLKDADTEENIYNISDVIVVDEDSDGYYSFFVTSLMTSLNRVLQCEWSYSVGGQSSIETQYYRVETPYASVSSIQDFLGFGNSPEDMNYYSPQEIVSAEKLARTIIDGYTMQTFGTYYGSQEIRAIGSDACQLTEKMLILDKVWENDVLVIDNTSDPVYNTFGFILEITPTGKAIRIVNQGWDVRYDNQVDPAVLTSGRFRDNSRYKFMGQIGYKYVPEDIKIASMLLVNDIISNDYNWRNKYLKKVDLSEISFEMAPGAFNGTGNIAVDNILDLYRNLNIVVI